MPALTNPKGFKLQTLDPSSPKGKGPQGFKVGVGTRVAKALTPEIFRGKIPDRVTLSEQAPPFAGELSEEQFGKLKKLGIGDKQVVASLRRRWNYVGFSVDPGALGGQTMTAALSVMVRGMRAIVPATILTIVGGNGPVASTAFVMACRCELILIGPNAGEGAEAVTDLRGTIWGMSEQ